LYVALAYINPVCLKSTLKYGTLTHPYNTGWILLTRGKRLFRSLQNRDKPLLLQCAVTIVVVAIDNTFLYLHYDDVGYAAGCTKTLVLSTLFQNGLDSKKAHQEKARGDNTIMTKGPHSQRAIRKKRQAFVFQIGSL
jgi:hypothetical protein